MNVPSASRIYLIILIGICSMLFSVILLLGDLKQSGYWTKFYPVVNKAGNNPSVDTLWVVHQKQIAKNDSLALANRGTEGSQIHYSQLLFHYNSTLLVWIILFSLMFSVAASLLLIFLGTIWEINRSFKIAVKSRIVTLVITLVLGLVIFLTSSYNPYLFDAISLQSTFQILLNHPYRLNFIIVPTLLVGLIGLLGHLTVNNAIDKLTGHVGESSVETLKAASRKFKMLHDSLKFFLVADAALIVLTILATDALRRAILSEITTNIDIYPSSFVYAYGFVFTFYLAVFYIPIFYRLRKKGASFSLLTDKAPDEQEDYLATFLIKESPLQTFITVFSILSPVISSFAPGLLKF